MTNETQTQKHARLVTTAWAVIGLVFCLLIFGATWTAGLLSGRNVDLSEGFMVLFGSTVAALGMVLTSKGYYRTGKVAMGVIALIVMLAMVSAISLIPVYFDNDVGVPTEVLGLFGAAVVALHSLLKPGV